MAKLSRLSPSHSGRINDLRRCTSCGSYEKLARQVADAQGASHLTDTTPLLTPGERVGFPRDVVFGPKSLREPGQADGLDVDDFLRMAAEERKSRLEEEAVARVHEEYQRRKDAWKRRHQDELEELEKRKISCELKCAMDKVARDKAAQDAFDEVWANAAIAGAGGAALGGATGAPVAGIGAVPGAAGGFAIGVLGALFAAANKKAVALAESLLKYDVCKNECKRQYDAALSELEKDI